MPENRSPEQGVRCAQAFTGHKQQLRIKNSTVLSGPTAGSALGDEESQVLPRACVTNAQFCSEASLKTERSFGEMS